MKPKILIFLTRFPYPATDGTRHKILDDVVSGLTKNFELNFLIVTNEKPSTEQVKFLEDNFGQVTVFYYPKWQVWKNVCLTLFSSYPLQAGYYYFKKVQDWFIKNLVNYDAVYAHTLRLGKYLEKLSAEQKKKIMLDFNDAISLNYQEAKKKASLFWRFIYSLEANRVKNYEKKLLNTLNYFNVVSQFDKEYLLQNVNITKIIFNSIPHGVNSVLFNTLPISPQKRLVFMGNLSYPPNLDAIQYFLKNIFSQILEKMPNLQLCIIGGGNNLTRQIFKNVTFTGFIKEPAQLIADSSIFVAPLRFGAGMPTKILEAMALGLPVITTPLGARGIPGLIDKNNILIKDFHDTAGWANLVCDIVSNEPLRKNIGNKARDFIKENYSDKIAGQKFCDFFTEIIYKK